MNTNLLNPPTMMEVETKNASLDTLAVTIQALHVSGKQMTLSVFRQLPQSDAYEEDGSLMPTLEHWGIVRYEIKDQGAIWLVASRQGRLYRCNAANRFESVLLATDNLIRVRRDLVLYKHWEVLRIEYERQQRIYEEAKKELRDRCPFPVAQNGWRDFSAWEKQQPEYPKAEYPSNPFPYSNVKIGERAVYEQWVMNRAEGLENAQRAHASHTQLMSLVQLFIAV